jgi:hypothetical protein
MSFTVIGRMILPVFLKKASISVIAFELDAGFLAIVNSVNDMGIFARWIWLGKPRPTTGFLLAQE